MSELQCPKCGARDYWTRWRPDDNYRLPWDCPTRNPSEHLCRGCRGCQYQWDDPIADIQPERDAPDIDVERLARALKVVGGSFAYRDDRRSAKAIAAEYQRRREAGE